MCNCNRTERTEKPKGYITQAKTIVKKIWEKSQLQEKPVTVTKINKT